MKHFVLGYPDIARKGAVTVLYAGDSRQDARNAMFTGAEGIVIADYVCNPQVSQSKRFHKTAKVVEPIAPPASKPVAEWAEEVAVPPAPEAPLLPAEQETAPDLPSLSLPKKAKARDSEK